MRQLKYLKHLFRKDGQLPIHVGLIATYRCNARCKSCFVWQDPKTGEELTAAEFEKIGASLGDLLWLQVGGGEPFLRQDLPRVVNAFNAVNVSIPTNALLPDKIYSDLEKILAAGKMDVLQLSVSLDALGGKHDELRGVKGNFDKVLETLKKVRPLKDGRDNFSVSVNTVISRENEDELQGIVDFVRDELSVDYHSFEFLRGSPRDEAMNLPSPDKVGDIVAVIKKTIKDYGFYGGLGLGKSVVQSAKLITQDMVEDVLTGGKRVMPCYAGRLNAFIDAYGDVLPCELLDYKFGNLRDYNFDFKKLWLSPETSKARDFIKNECYCTHSCIMLTNILFNPWLYPRLAKGLVELKT